MLLQLNRKRRALRNFLHDLDLRHSDFESARRTFFSTDLPGNDDARFLRQPAQRRERLRLLFLRDDALQQARAVAKNREQQLAGLALVVQPAADGDFLILMFGDAIDGDDGHSVVISLLAPFGAITRALGSR